MCSGHIPYRDSKLTRILQPALGGNSRTAIICTITPAAIHCEETHSTLKFASRAKTITNKPQVNETLDDQTMLKRLQKEVTSLKNKLAGIKDGNYIEEVNKLQLEKQKVEEDKGELMERLREKEALHRAQEEKINRLANLILVSHSAPVAVTEEDTKKKARSARRETWCPGEGKLPSFGFARPFPKRNEVKKPVTMETRAEPQETFEIETLSEKDQLIAENSSVSDISYLQDDNQIEDESQFEEDKPERNLLDEL